MPAQSLYIHHLIQQDRIEEAHQALEPLTVRFPYHPDVLRAQVQIQMAQEQWIESAILVPEVANIAATLAVASYSCDMERQSDLLGTTLLSTGHYAADGLYNLMATLETEYGNSPITWFSSHPNPGERIRYLKALIDQGGLNRYAYEGVETHLTVRRKTMQLLQAYRLEQNRPNKDPYRR